MEPFVFFMPGKYQNPLSSEGRTRTIAAFHVTEGFLRFSKLAMAPMRRDILRDLLSPSVINYWLNKKQWIAEERPMRKMRFLSLTSLGAAECDKALVGLAHINTTQAMVEDKIQAF